MGSESLGRDEAAHAGFSLLHRKQEPDTRLGMDRRPALRCAASSSSGRGGAEHSGRRPVAKVCGRMVPLRLPVTLTPTPGGSLRPIYPRRGRGRGGAASLQGRSASRLSGPAWRPRLRLAVRLWRPGHGFGGQRHGGGARVGADPAEAGRAGVHLPGAVSGPGGRAEPGLGHGRPPVLPVPVGVLPEARQLGHLALRVHAQQRNYSQEPGTS
ncbi:uncharacterized protein LOC109460286 isoform X1 [Rhinolophus sinicus]|uniref:uncharacterized protein LOC109460286 isoform X1 n=1 Tax=Rhinolophus sinicus TaxID=89399 RepID=UPI003D79B39D